MALILPAQKAGSYRSWATVNLSTNSDGFTGGDILDCSGLTFSCMALSSLAGSSCAYTFRVSPDTTDNMQLMLTSSGGPFVLGATGNASQQKTFGFDPSPFVGFRYVLPVSLTTGQPNSNSPGAQARMGVSAFGYVP